MARKMKKFDDQGRADRAIAKITGDSNEPLQPKIDTDLASNKSIPKLNDSMSFGDAFKAARADKGAGSTFTWRGKSYSTNRADESSSKPKPRTQVTSPTPKSATRRVDDSAANLVADMQRGSPLSQPKSSPDKVTPDMLSRIQGIAGAKYDPRHPNMNPAQLSELARLRAAAEASTASGYDKDRYKYAESSGMVNYKKGGAVKKKTAAKKAMPVKKYAKGGSIDGCAIRGKTRAKRAK